MADPRIAFIGAGNMAASIIGGLVAEGFSAQSIAAADPSAESLARIQGVAPVRIATDNHSAVADADVVVLAVKPQVMRTVAEALAPALQARKPLLISIAAGIEVASLARWLGPDLPIVRCMPNTPALVQRGATALYANAAVSAAQRELADRILRAVGIALWVDDEAALDAVTAVSGSGPAYFFLVMEAIQASGEALGLSPEVARQLTLQTALGAAQMAIASDVDAGELRRRVTSPNGTTERAVASFEDAGLRDIFLRALTACRDRSRELAQELGSE
ncbi:MAG TPA: pyrroline-5-carboxylate reductase [Spongiibacteraceae bacterium]|nr:pyrroline-5-carboxylate reductase [Spongiibacteraceae bacterium]